MAKIINANNLTKIYGEKETSVTALDDINIEFRENEFTAIMGPSGSGKSTLLHCLAGLDRPTSGKIFLKGNDIATLNDKELTKIRRDSFGFIFQAFNLIPTLTAEENITLPASIAGRKPDMDWVKEVVETVDIADRLSHRPNELSGGQQQRVAAARAMATKPEVIFADEPSGNLDSKSSRELLTFMKSVVEELNQTIVMVTHDPFAASFAGRVVMLKDGRIASDLGNDIATLNDKELTKIRRDSFGFIFQAFNLIPTLTAEENITLPASIAGRKPDMDWVKEVVETVDIADRLSHRPNELSGGQQQRVAAARAMATKPEVIFADEPSGNLDSKSSRELLTFMKSVVEELNQTIVMVTHDPFAASFAGRVVMLKDGRIASDLEKPTQEEIVAEVTALTNA